MSENTIHRPELEEFQEFVANEGKKVAWSEATIEVRYNFRGKLKSKKFHVEKAKIREDHIKAYAEQYQEMVDYFGEDGEQLGDRPTPEEFAETYEVTDFEEGVLHHAESLSRQNIIERGGVNNEYVVLPPTAIVEVVVTVKDKAAIVLPN